MSDVVIRVEGLGKRYRIGGPQARHRSFREAIVDGATAPFRRLGRALRGGDGSVEETIWALRNVSLDIKRGEAVGIIGRNGAGKSTLLKILSRITEPTEGRVRIKGRVGSLLEVGTGFHHELTGRENVYLNGAILGMKKTDIDRRFDEIVAFAEIDRFLDTPVKHYSSGMYMRLAFAVAAHLDPDILLVDEVLAVGDAAFQRKCLGRMGEVARQERTVLFVSHNLPAVTGLCTHGIWLDSGSVRMDGASREVVDAYTELSAESSGERRWPDRDHDPGNTTIRLRSARVCDDRGGIRAVFDASEPISLEIEYQLHTAATGLGVGFRLQTSDGTLLFVGGDTEDERFSNGIREPGVWVSRAVIPGGLLNAGAYFFSIGVDLPAGNTIIMEQYALRIQVSMAKPPAHSAHAGWRPPGLLCPSLRWSVEQRGDVAGQAGQ
jgi:lipopolysaccharide transport system ATP-binding protein